MFKLWFIWFVVLYFANLDCTHSFVFSKSGTIPASFSEGGRALISKAKNEMKFLPIVAALLLPLPSLAVSHYVDSDTTSLAREWKLLSTKYYDVTYNGKGKDWWFNRRKTYMSDPDCASDVGYCMTKLASELNDKYTTYLTPAQYGALLSSSKGSLVGIGVTLTTCDDVNNGSDNQVCLKRVEPNGPAAKIGLKINSKLVSVDSSAVTSPYEASYMLRDGIAGSRVVIKTESVDGSVDEYVVNREKVVIQGVTLDKERGTIKISSFTEKTVEDVEAILKSCKPDDVIKIDLTSNPGGVLTSAINLASLFLRSDSTVIKTIDRTGTRVERVYVTGEYVNNPLIIYVDKDTASASEVFASSVKDNQRGVVVGVGSAKTYGKGVIQTVLPISDTGDNLGAVKITIAKYVGANGEDINNKGVEVDERIDAISQEGGKVEELARKKAKAYEDM